jgi:exonuclease SbcD
MKILILGDPHIGKGTQIGKVGIGGNVNSRILDQINLLDWVLDYSVDNHIEQIIITGDVFEEPRPAPNLITLFISWLKRCQAHDIYVHIIRGNHDIVRAGNIYTSPLDVISEIDFENVSVYKEINTIILETTAFTMVPFRDRKSYNVASNAQALSLLNDSLAYEIAGIPLFYKKVLVGHLALEGSIPVGDEIDDLSNELFCPLSMFKEYDYTWLGHVHKPQVLSKTPHIAHIGSMDISNFGETDHKKYVVILDTNANNKSFEIQNLPTRPLKKLTIEVPEDVIDSHKYVSDYIESLSDLDKSIVKVDIQISNIQSKNTNKQQIEKLLSDKGVFSISQISESRKAVSVKKDENKTKIHSQLDVNNAIKTYGELFVPKESQDIYLDLALSILKEFKMDAK